jgi:hypothetical protein
MAIESGTGTAGSVVIEGKRRKGSGGNLNFSINVPNVQILVHDHDYGMQIQRVLYRKSIQLMRSRLVSYVVRS